MTMGDYLSTEQLHKSALPEEDVDIPGKGKVRVRALTRIEAMSCQQVKDGPGQTAAIERKMLALAMVAPEMTEAAVGQWQKSSAAGEMDTISNKVAELSGMTEGAAKEAYKEFDANPDDEFRLPPSD